MRVGLGVLRLPPQQFWAMTPRELEAAIHGIHGRVAQSGRLSRCELTDLMRQFPDHADACADGPRALHATPIARAFAKA